jgi:antirestriction protein
MEQERHEQQGGGNHAEPADTKPEREPRLVPRIYVASLSDYNDDRLVGEWLDAAVESNELAAGVQAMLTASPTPRAEEWAIHDYEGFGPLHLEEYESLETVATVARGIAEHGPAFAHYAALVGTSDAEELARFEDAYLGHAESAAAYAEELWDDLGYRSRIEAAVPEYLQPYVSFDVAGFARDLELSGDIATSEGDGGVYVFDPRG